jgi:hypothetical protein
VAVVGADGAEGGWVRAALEVHGVPSARVDLFGLATDEAVLSEYAGEARLVQALEPDCLDRHAVVFLCRAQRVARLPDRALVLALGRTGGDAPLAHEPLLPLENGAGRCRIPDSLAVVLAELLAPLRSLGPTSVQAVVLRPAAGYGPEGLDELREQSVRLLRFEPAPTAVFGRPLAFNLIPDPASGGRHGDAARVASDVGDLLGPGAPAITLRTASGPWFHGHVMFVHVQGITGGREGLRRALQEAQGVEVLPDDACLTPAEGPEERRTIVFEAEAVPGGGWIRALAAEAETAAARQAVAVAAAAGRL